MSLVVSRLRAWVTVFFDELWRLIPAQPILFPFFFVSGLLALAFPPASHLIATVWVALSVTSPVLVLLAWWMITYQHGFMRYWGMWIRTVGDVGQTVALIVAIVLWWSVVPPPLVVILFGIAVFVGVLVVRDLLALWLVEKVASKLYLDVHNAAAR